MFVLLQVLAEQVLAVVVSVWSAHYHVNVLVVWNFRILRQVSKIRRQLVVKLDQNHWTVNAIVEDARRIGPS